MPLIGISHASTRTLISSARGQSLSHSQSSYVKLPESALASHAKKNLVERVIAPEVGGAPENSLEEEKEGVILGWRAEKENIVKKSARPPLKGADKERKSHLADERGMCLLPSDYTVDSAPFGQRGGRDEAGKAKLVCVGMLVVDVVMIWLVLLIWVSLLRLLLRLLAALAELQPEALLEASHEGAERARGGRRGLRFRRQRQMQMMMVLVQHDPD